MANFADLLKKVSAPGIQNTGHIGSAGIIDLGWSEYLAKKLGLDNKTDDNGSNVIPGANSTGTILNNALPVHSLAMQGASQLAGGNTSGNQPTTNTATQSNPSNNVWLNNSQQTQSTPRLQELQEIEKAGNLNPSQRTELSNLLQGSGENNYFNDALSNARSSAKAAAEQGYNRARGIFDEGMGLLNQRKQEFTENYNQGNQDILNSYEGNRGELQSSNKGAETRLGNSLRALGLGGSAFVKSQGKLNQDSAKALGNLQTEKSGNEAANLSDYNTNNQWADTQQSSLQRSLEDASNARSAADSSTDVNYLNNMGNMFQTLLNNAISYQNAANTYTANPYSVNMNSYTDALNGSVPSTTTTGTTTGNEAANINNDATLASLLKKAGVAGSGLYSYA